MDNRDFCYQYDATLVGAERDPERTVVDRPSTQNRSGDEGVLPQERTVIWPQEEQLDLNRVAARLASHGGRLSARGQFFAAIGIATVFIVGILAVIFEERGPARKSRNLVVQLPTPEPLFVPPIPSRPMLGKPSPTGSVPLADSKLAVDALVDGRLDQAMTHFQALKERHPASEPYGLIVDILAASLEAGTP